MQISINQNPYPLCLPMSLAQLLEQLDLTRPGVALAVNGEVIGRADWERRQLKDGDQLSLFQAIAGG